MVGVSGAEGPQRKHLERLWWLMLTRVWCSGDHKKNTWEFGPARLGQAHRMCFCTSFSIPFSCGMTSVLSCLELMMMSVLATESRLASFTHSLSLSNLLGWWISPSLSSSFHAVPVLIVLGPLGLLIRVSRMMPCGIRQDAGWQAWWCLSAAQQCQRV